LFLTPNIITNLLLESVFLFLSLIAFFISIKIIKNWDMQRNDTIQFNLQKKSYLFSLIVKYILTFKILLLLFFVYTLDDLSNIINGAMCGVGVLDASSYGIYLMLLKIIDVYLFSFWLVVNRYDFNHPYMPYMKQKALFFIFIFFILIAEYILEVLYFLDINPQEVVNCCGVIFSASKTTILSSFLSLEAYKIYTSFYVVVLLLVLSYYFKQRYLYAIFSALFVVIALLSLIGYFGTYIYELPTHHCPFCLLQKDYNFIGYILYAVLFVATFNGMVLALFEDKKRFKISVIFVLIYTALVSFYPLFYFYKNSVWLY
jgi:hypothetical protein